MKKVADYSPKRPIMENLVRNVSDFVRIVERTKRRAEAEDNNADLLFRGQRSDDPLLPKLARLREDGKLRPRKSLCEIEALILKEFKRTSIPYLERECRDEWDWLAVAQHHGLPTRLLDWSFNALQALWFAVERPPKVKDGEEQHGVVWIFLAETEDYRHIQDDPSPFDIKFTKIFRPRIVSRRLSSQLGAFTAHAINKDSKVIALEKNTRYKSKLRRIVIQPESFPVLRKQLDILGINSATTFSDLDALCKHLAWRFAYHDDESRKRDELSLVSLLSSS